MKSFLREEKILSIVLPEEKRLISQMDQKQRTLLMRSYFLRDEKRFSMVNEKKGGIQYSLGEYICSPLLDQSIKKDDLRGLRGSFGAQINLIINRKRGSKKIIKPKYMKKFSIHIRLV